MEHLKFPFVRTRTLDWESLGSNIAVDPVETAVPDHLFEREGTINDIGHDCTNDDLNDVCHPARLLAKKLLKHVPPGVSILAVQFGKEIFENAGCGLSFCIYHLVERFEQIQ